MVQGLRVVIRKNTNLSLFQSFERYPYKKIESMTADGIQRTVTEIANTEKNLLESESKKKEIKSMMKVK